MNPMTIKDPQKLIDALREMITQKEYDEKTLEQANNILMKIEKFTKEQKNIRK